MEAVEFIAALEAVLFAAAAPMTRGDLRRVFTRLWASEDEAARDAHLAGFDAAVAALRERWAHRDGGFELVEVAEGLTFRTHPRHAEALRAMRDDARPQRLSRPALETLSIVAYRQPVTKPEVDHIRGVDCGGTFKVLLDRNLVRIVGKKEEVGRPLLYGTSRDFLSLFNLANLTELPSLREFHELDEASAEEVRTLEAGMPSLQELSDSATQLQLGEEPAADLDAAVDALDKSETSARDALREAGISMAGEEAPQPAPAAAVGDGAAAR